ncbi:MAG TPA: hypothetical protein DDW25_09745 [Ktedonobacter sp.]|nr:hypothetical protein [Ktedonobacter sp.]
MRAPPDTRSLAESSRTSSGSIQRRWLALARGAWIVCALLLLANFVASIPAYYQIMRTVCTLPYQVPCTMPGQPGSSSGQLTLENVQALAHLHLSLTAYAAYFVTLDVVVSLLAWGVGLLIFWRKSDERMGLFVSLLLVLFGATGSGNTLLGVWAPTPSPPLLSHLLSLISGAVWIGLGAFLLTFPTGRFTPRWSWLVFSFWFIVLLWNAPPPFLILQGVAGLLTLGGTLFIMVYRYVRVFDAIQRQQAKWVVYAAVAALSLLAIGTGPSGAVPADSPYQLLFPTVQLFSSALLYLGLGFAILRYHLWDIDAIINRTLVYGSLTALLALLYVGLIFALQSLFQGMFHLNNDVTIVISTLVIAALFQPLRHRIQQVIDRRFYRRKYDAARMLAQFSATLRNEVDLTTLSEQLGAVVEETMQPTHVSLWLRKDDQRRKPNTDA